MPSSPPLTATCLFAALLAAAGNLRAQAPEAGVAPPPTSDLESRILRANYPRPDLKTEIFKPAEIKLTPAEIDELVRHLAVLARNFPDDRRLTMEMRAKVLAIALRLRPDDRNCVVANGQLARGLNPLPITGTDIPNINQVSLHLLNLAVQMFKADSADSRILAHCLLDLASQLDESNRKVLHALQGDGKPPIDWHQLLHTNRRPDFQDEEAADLRLDSTYVLLFCPQASGYGPLRISAKAEKFPAGQRRNMQILYPNEARRIIEPHLPALRDLLRGRHSEWPTGWKIDLNMPSNVPPENTAAPLGIALVLESLIAGEALDDSVRTACGLRADNGQILRTAPLEMILDRSKSEAAASLIILAPENSKEVADALLVRPERLADLARIPLVEARTFGECFALAQLHRPPALQRSLDQFRTMGKTLAEGGIAALRNPAAQAALDEVLLYNPNLVSARYLLAASRKELPSTLSRAAGIKALRDLGASIISAVGQRHPLQLGKWQRPLEATPFAKARISIERLRNLLDNDSRALADAMVDLARIYDSILLHPPASPVGRQNYLNQIREPRKRMVAAFRLLEPNAPPPLEEAPPGN